MGSGGTIVARATAPGQARRTLIRISGPETAIALQALGIEVPAARGAFHARAVLQEACTLPMLVLRFVAPASYTGEDAAELLIPANHALAERLIERLCEADHVRRAGPGEFTARAYLAGRLTLAQAEAVAARIAAETQDELQATDRLLSGQAGVEHRAWVDRLATLLARVEAGIDFADQEAVVSIPSAELAMQLRSLRDELVQSVGEAYCDWPTERPLVVLLGPANAGKSTLFNALLERERVVASPVAGTTRDVIIEPLDLADTGGPVVDLADLPGLEASEAERTHRALSAVDRADVVIMCDPTDRFDHAPPAAAELIRVHTKADEHLPSLRADLSICSLDGWHFASLRRAIVARLGRSRRAIESRLIPRHRHVVAEAIAHLDAACEQLQHQDPHSLHEPEIIAASLRLALDRLGELVGEVSPDEIIGRIFATFCIGK